MTQMSHAGVPSCLFIEYSHFQSFCFALFYGSKINLFSSGVVKPHHKDPPYFAYSLILQIKSCPVHTWVHNLPNPQSHKNRSFCHHFNSSFYFMTHILTSKRLLSGGFQALLNCSCYWSYFWGIINAVPQSSLDKSLWCQFFVSPSSSLLRFLMAFPL